jgi:hypothetical protein
MLIEVLMEWRRLWDRHQNDDWLRWLDNK